MSIRTRVTLATVVLAALAIGTVDVTTFWLLRREVHARADTSVRSVARTAVVALKNGEKLSLSAFAGADRPVLVELLNARGKTVSRVGTAEADDVRLPAGLLAHPGRPQQISSPESHRPAFEVIAVPAASGTVVAAISLRSDINTLDSLVRLNFFVGAAVLGILAIVAAVVLTRSLRPLRQIAVTADAIAAGDLTARVPEGPRRSEVGRVGSALNRMLAENEAAFAKRDATEDKLRRFLADVSHELRTPLTSIRGYAELFRRGASRRPEDLAKAMRAIEDEAARMGILVEDLLLVARLDDERQLERGPVALDDVAEAAVDAARAVEPDRTLTFAFSERPITVTGDQDRLRQAVDNLLANVRAHTPAGAPAYLSVRTDGDQAVLTVEDTGPGVPDWERERIFDRFFRPGTALDRRQGGAGLGLAIVRSIVTAHGGEISVRAANPHGSIFEIRLPRLVADSRVVPS